ncbi:MAG: hypothetical protein Q7K55_07835 [Candidatus Levybacteria bacterium]|nr:hypothetical protein [Candidatus Levybacteria bacterium]
MSNKLQTSKNIELTGKLLDYLSSGKNSPNLPEDVSIVPFSKNNKKLNSANEKLVEILSKEKPVAIAEEPKTEKQDWKIIPVNF